MTSFQLHPLRDLVYALCSSDSRQREREGKREREREGERLATVVQNAVEWSRGDILDGFQALGSIKGV